MGPEKSVRFMNDGMGLHLASNCAVIHRHVQLQLLLH